MGKENPFTRKEFLRFLALSGVASTLSACGLGKKVEEGLSEVERKIYDGLCQGVDAYQNPFCTSGEAVTRVDSPQDAAREVIKSYEGGLFMSGIEVRPTEVSDRVNEIMGVFRQLGGDRIFQIGLLGEEGETDFKGKIERGLIPVLKSERELMGGLPEDLSGVKIAVSVGPYNHLGLSDSLFLAADRMNDPDNLTLVFDPVEVSGVQQILPSFVEVGGDEGFLPLEPTVFVEDVFRVELLDSLVERGAQIEKVLFVSPDLYHRPRAANVIVGIAERMVESGGELELYMSEDDFSNFAESDLMPRLEGLAGGKVERTLLGPGETRPLSDNYESDSRVHRIRFGRVSTEE